MEMDDSACAHFLQFVGANLKLHILHAPNTRKISLSRLSSIFLSKNTIKPAQNKIPTILNQFEPAGSGSQLRAGTNVGKTHKSACATAESGWHAAAMGQNAEPLRFQHAHSTSMGRS